MKTQLALTIIQPTGLPRTPANQTTLSTILNDVFILLGAVCVLMVLIGGLRYVFARGNPESAAKAKNNIQYSIIGIVIAALAASIVNYVLGKV
ncbi:MAG TPA: pilin [Candidatus Saccharimonadales bacterium]|nr:pilin [Candidatus Saccharimonadales bacterium]